MNQHEALRKAAILITALDAATADALLDRMPEAQSALVRQAVFDLDWVDPAEQDQVLADFWAATNGQEPAVPSDNQVTSNRADNSDVELMLSSETPNRREPFESAPSPRRVAATVESYPVHYSKPKAVSDTQPRFEFLRGQAGSTLARLLEREHPQSIAVVAAHLPPEQSAEMLRELPADLNVEVLRRIADIDEIDPETIDDMEHELRRSFRVSAIINAEQSADDFDVGDETDDPLADVASNQTTNLASEIEAYRQLAHSIPDAAETKGHGEEEIIHERPIDWSFADVTLLSDMDLANVLQEAGSELTMVALAGSHPEFVARLSNQLSPVMARQFMSRMEEIGPLPLRDIEAAQERIAEIAGSLAEDGIISQKDSEPFAAAA